MSNMNNELKFNDEAVTLVKVIGEILKSRTQSVKVLLLEKDGKQYVSVQKWWRKDAEEPWMEGKGFHFNPEEGKNIGEFIQEAVNLVK